MSIDNHLDRASLGRVEVEAIRAHLAQVPRLVASVDDFVIHDVVCTETVQALKDTMNQITDLRSARMRERVSAGWSRGMIARVLGVTRSRVDQLVTR